MTLRPLLELAYADDSISARWRLPQRRRSRASAHASAAIQPYLIAALADDPDALGGSPVVVVAPDDVGARDLARELGAYLAPRRVHHYPSRGTGYASHIAPPPHLVGPADRRARRARPPPARTSRRSSSPAPSPSPRRSRTRRCAPRASRSPPARRSTSTSPPSCSSRRATSASTRWRSAASSRSAATSSTSSRPPRSAPPGSSCSATRSSRSAGSRPSPSARSARSKRIELAPGGRAGLRAPPAGRGRRWRTASGPDLARGSCRSTRFRAPLDLIGDDAAFVIAGAEEIELGAHAPTGRT